MARYWLSYDLGLRGNYDELYEWLDRAEARECGDSTATFVSDRTRAQIKAELAKLLGKTARVYLIGKESNGKFRGGFILGHRKQRPIWQGYAAAPTAESEEEE